MSVPTTILDHGAGSISLREVFESIDPSTYPVRLEIPCCLMVDIRDEDGLLNLLARLDPGADEYDNITFGYAEAVLYAGWDDQRAAYGDESHTDWDDQ